MNHKITIGIAWNFASMLLSHGSSIIFMLFLARLLAPDSFGLIAMMIIMMQLGRALGTVWLGRGADT